jgi:hypothetical protein
VQSKVKRAISVRQPYAEQILKGCKTREYRGVPTNIRERVYIYASERPGNFFDYDLLGLEYEDLPRGVLVGSVEIVGCEWSNRANEYAYLLANPRRLRRRLKPVKKPQPIWFFPF